MRNMKPYPLLVLVFSLVSAACSSNAVIPTSDPPATSLPATRQPQDAPATPAPPVETLESAQQENLTRIDEQGMVIVEVTPLNLSITGDTLAFEVALDTHSVDLSMDLAAVSTLNFGSGKSLQASLWDAPRGGHHVSGTLYFPATLDGQPALKDAGEVQLVIENLDAPERIFTWKVNP